MNQTPTKEIRQDLFTVTAYAKRIKKSVSWVSQLVRDNKIDTVTVNGTVLIKLPKNK